MSNSNINQINIPQAREPGSVGEQMVKNVCPTRTVYYVRNNRISAGHVQNVQYIASFSL